MHSGTAGAYVDQRYRSAYAFDVMSAGVRHAEQLPSAIEFIPRMAPTDAALLATALHAHRVRSPTRRSRTSRAPRRALQTCRCPRTPRLPYAPRHRAPPLPVPAGPLQLPFMTAAAERGRELHRRRRPRRRRPEGRIECLGLRGPSPASGAGEPLGGVPSLALGLEPLEGILESVGGPPRAPRGAENEPDTKRSLPRTSPKKNVRPSRRRRRLEPRGLVAASSASLSEATPAFGASGKCCRLERLYSRQLGLPGGPRDPRPSRPSGRTAPRKIHTSSLHARAPPRGPRAFVPLLPPGPSLRSLKVPRSHKWGRRIRPASRETNEAGTPEESAAKP